MTMAALKESTVQEDLSEFFKKDFSAETTGWEAFRQILGWHGVDTAHIHMLSWNPRNAPGVYAVYASADGRNPVKSFAFDEALKLVVDRAHDGLKDWRQ